MKIRMLTVLCCSLAACGGKQRVEVAAPTAPALSVDGNARLSDNVVPTAYRLALDIDPSKETFLGTTEIDITVKAQTPGIIVHAEDLKMSNAVLVTGDVEVPAELQPGENNGLGLSFLAPVAPGKHTLKFTYTAGLDEVPTGLYRVNEADAWYAFTQFEPLEARQAFPSFDEPKFKTPFDVTIRVPAGQLAFANTPEVSRETVGDRDVFTFATSKPLPTYLVAFAVGPLDVLDGGDIDGTPFRLIATKGNAALGQFMVDNTPILLRTLTEYFGQPYPYEKLDVVAVPNFSAGAMENVGLVTFRETLLLLDPKNMSVQEKRSAMSVMAHELAHMWFGNLVTLPWWEDIWLNEGFATWMAARVLAQVMPELESRVDNVDSVGWVIGADSRAQARPIRQKIAHGGDIYNAFGAIAYGKGAAVLRLFEAWLGEDVFRDGVRAYLAKHQHGTGTTESLLESLGEVSDKPVARAMGSFLDQPGAPLLTISKACTGDKTTLSVEQSRYLPAGSEADQTGPWEVPVCVAWPDGRETKSHCTLVSGKTATIELPATKCPDWYYPNAGQVGYYRWSTEDANLAKLMDGRAFAGFDTQTKVEIFSNVEALSRAEVIGADRYLAMLVKMSGESHRTLVREAIRGLYGIDKAVPADKRAAFQRVAAKLLKPHLSRLGFEPTAGEAVDRSLLRPTVVEAAAFLTQDAAITTWATATTERFSKQMDSVPVETVRLALPLAAWNAEASLWLSYKLIVDSAPTPAIRVAAINGLGSFREPQLLKRSLDMFFTTSIRSQDMWSLIGPSFERDETFAITWAWFKENFEQIVEKIGNKSVPRLPSVGSGFCTPEGRKEVADFFAEPGRQKPGQDQNLANTLEGIDQCMRRRAYLAGGLDSILK